MSISRRVDCHPSSAHMARTSLISLDTNLHRLLFDYLSRNPFENNLSKSCSLLYKEAGGYRLFQIDKQTEGVQEHEIFSLCHAAGDKIIKLRVTQSETLKRTLPLCPNLEELSIRLPYIRKENSVIPVPGDIDLATVQTLGAHRALRKLVLEASLSEESLSYLLESPYLEELHWVPCHLILNLLALSHPSPSLTTLRLSYNRVTRNTLIALRDLPSLKALYLTSSLTEKEALEGLSSLSQIHTLCLNGNRLESRDLSFLSSLTSLTCLYLHDNRLDDTLIAYLSTLVSLQELGLARNCLSYEGIVRLAQGLPHLTALYLAKKDFTERQRNKLVGSFSFIKFS